MYSYLYCENGGLERLSDDMRFFPNLSINAKNLFFIVSGTLHAYVGSCLHAHASWLCVHAEGFLGLNFSKIDFFAH